VAYSGRGFLGRHDRSWRTEPGNLQAVVHLTPYISPAKAGAAFSILAAESCIDALEQAAAPEPGLLGIKWVNDILAGSSKIGGVLTRLTYQDPHITHAFLGLGVNVLVNPGVPANPFVPHTNCLRHLFPDRSWTPGGFLLLFLERLEIRYQNLLNHGVGPLLEYYRKHSKCLNRPVRIYEDGYGFSEEVIHGRKILAQGTVRAIEDDLSLRIEGKNDPVTSGRLAFEEDCVA
ncbi:MAG: hypothetical protein KJ645_09530, partial [Planctomycetes bacterium]|nr:hypothetical protein [Planctomycetota bacterium]